MKLWHYTTKESLDRILDSEVIKLALRSVNKNEKAAAWLSSNPLWENTATKFKSSFFGGAPIRLTKEQQYKEFGLGRIEIEVPPNTYTWKNYKKISGIDSNLARGFELSGKEQNANPQEWYACLNEISINYWVKAEIWDGKQWQLYEEFDIIEE
jgi:hypothetical protein